MLLALLASLALDVPYVSQEKDTCGAAALAMVLAYWEVPAPQGKIAEALLQPELHGILGSRLVSFARERGLTAFAYAGDLDHLREYLSKGRPLIVAWKVGRDRYHDVVVVGFDDERKIILVNDPAEGPARPIPTATFEQRWAGAGHWTLLVLPAQQ
jgi:ABC-type bacteriocin/lantibiotic exporter with double-glycine peptidase domain